jgi:hypothetical protein
MPIKDDIKEGISEFLIGALYDIVVLVAYSIIFKYSDIDSSIQEFIKIVAFFGSLLIFDKIMEWTLPKAVGWIAALVIFGSYFLETWEYELYLLLSVVYLIEKIFNLISSFF